MRVIGQIERLEPEVQEIIDESVTRLQDNTGLQLTFAISYGARTELARAARLFAEDCLAGRASPEEMSEERMTEYLWTRDFGDLSDVDLVIRTSGEKRSQQLPALAGSLRGVLFHGTVLAGLRANAIFMRRSRTFAERERRYRESAGGSFGCADSASAPGFRFPDRGGVDRPPARVMA